MQVFPKGFRHIPSLLDFSAQKAHVETIRSIVEQAPLYRPEMPHNGKPFSVRMTNKVVIAIKRHIQKPTNLGQQSRKSF
jgi:alkylated DNA repair dioxygenase AlkB